MRKALIAFITFFCSTISFGQIFLIQEEFTAGLPFGWQVIDGDEITPHASLSQFNEGFIWQIDNGDSCMASTSYFADTTAQAEDYLITPRLSIPTFTKVSWEARSVDASYTESYYVLISTTDSLPASFTDTIAFIENEYFIWKRHSINVDTLGFANQDIFIAFRNASEDKYILQIDDVWVEGSDNASLPFSDFDFGFYPNPSHNWIKINVEVPFTATIHDNSGRQVMSSTLQKIDIQNLQEGNYFLTVQTEYGVSTKPFIKL